MGNNPISVEEIAFAGELTAFLFASVPLAEPAARRIVVEVDLGHKIGITQSGEVYKYVNPHLFSLIGYVIGFQPPSKGDPSEQTA